ncbi:hypothetical protein [Pannonibacter sp. SL95]|uniref:hypothetical protein n=1 Tax=Pannonibacter sp. SL95 TaxID=2995153 RepID=UPI0022726A12|nr:hypothetical protein [Pannonibacter sp. SL95]MCY1708364.1 hypothetical protein [Pannonibacter sp. SL95]
MASDPFSAGLMALSGILGLAGGGNSKAPEAKAPAIPAPVAHKSGADVRVGEDDTLNTDQTASEDYNPFMETRKSGVALGGLGRSGLSL